MVTLQVRKNVLKVAAGLSLAAFLFAGNLRAATFIPVLNGDFALGQWYFDGEESSLNGNMFLNVAPAVRFSNKFAVVPNITTNYRGTRSAEELAGGNTLFQDTWENGINVKAVHNLGARWKLRENMGYRIKWFRETTDESYGNGLYDYNIANVGLELQRNFKTGYVALGYDFSFLQFPNYESLESSQSSDLSREYAGSNVLDADVHLVNLRAGAPFFWGIKNGIQIYYSPRMYDSQTVVLNSGLLSSEKRQDDYIGTTVSMERSYKTSPKSNLSPMIFFSHAELDSNQNHYDAGQTYFASDFYSYKQNQIGAQLSFSLARTPAGPQVFSVGYSYSKRDYANRVTQNLDATYTSDKLYVKETNVSLGYSYPLARSLRLSINATFGRSRSNNDYEASYAYNFSNSNYLFGFHYEY